VGQELVYQGLHNSESSKGQIVNITLPWITKVSFHFDVEISL